MSSAKKRRDKSSLSARDRSVVIGGNVQGSNIIAGDNNVVNNYAPNFAKLYRYVNAHPELTPAEKEDAKAELSDVEKEVQKGENADQTFLARRFRNLQRMAPDILEVAFETLKNPASGVATVIQKIAKKMAEDAGEAK